MAGELWRSTLQIGKETTAGTAVAATRKLYVRDPVFTIERDPRYHRFATGTRDNVRAFTQGPIRVGGGFSLPVSADELLEFMLMGIKGAVTPTTPTGATAGRLWTFTPDPVLDVATFRWDDGANARVAAGNRVDQLTIAGSVGGENLATLQTFGQSMVPGALTGSLADRTPTFVEGWQTNLYLDTFGSTFGITPIPGLLISWSISLRNGLGRKYTASNTLNATSIPIGELAVEGNVMFEASSAQAVTEVANWLASTKRGVRLEFLSAAGEIEAGVNEVQSLVATSASSGTFTLSFRGQTTSTIAFNASAATVVAALEALSTIGAGGVTATGGALPGTPVVLTFAGALAGMDQPAITADNTLLVGGTAVITTTTPGYFGGRFVTIDVPGPWSAVNLGGSDAMTRTYNLNLSYVYDSVLAAGIRYRLQNNRTAAY